MSHDFFTFYMLCIEYKEEGEFQKTFFQLDETKVGHNWSREIYEEDDEEIKEELKKEYLSSILANYHPEIVYQNDQWKTHSVFNISKYVYIISNLKQINFDKVLHIWKMPEYKIYR